MKKNVPQVWDEVWSDPGLRKKDQLTVATEEGTVRWQKLHKVLVDEFGSIEGLRVIEIGSGIGTYSAILARHGARVTLLDYSPKALELAKAFLQNNKINASYIVDDALKPSKDLLKKKFDISISVGLTEHFTGEDRYKINKIHLDVLRQGGLAVMMVPNSYNLPYRIFKLVSELTGKWKFGEEYPYTRRELLDMAKRCKAECIALFGDDLYSSIRFLLPANFLRSFFHVGFPRTMDEVKKEKGTPLDDYFGYSLTVVLKK